MGAAASGLVLSEKETTECVLVANKKELRKHLHVFDILTAEVVVHLRENEKQEVLRVLRHLILVHGGVSLSQMPVRMLSATCGALCPAYSNFDNLRDYPHLNFGVRLIRSVGYDNDGIVTLQYDGGQGSGQTAKAVYQTPSPQRFLKHLCTNIISNYAGVPTWSVPIVWKLHLPLPAISDETLEAALGVDDGFSTALAGCINAAILVNQLEMQPRTPQQVTQVIMSHKENSHLPEMGIHGTKLFLIETLRQNMIPQNPKQVARLTVRALECLPFNVFYRSIVLGKITIRVDQKLRNEFKSALCRLLLYNVTIRELDLSNCDISHFGRGLGQALAMNIQPLLGRLRLSACHLTDDDVRGLLPGVLRLWCGGSAEAELLDISDNPHVSMDAWQEWWSSLANPTCFPYWPFEAPPAPRLPFLQHLNVSGTNAAGPALGDLLAKLEGLKTLSVGGQGEGIDYVLEVLITSAPTLKTFHGKSLKGSSLLAGALLGHSNSLQEVELEDFIGDATPFLCGWKEPVPKLSVVFRGNSNLCTVKASMVSPECYAPGKLELPPRPADFSRDVLEVIGRNSTGLKKLYIPGVPLRDFGPAAPILATCGLETLHANLSHDVIARVDTHQCRLFWDAMASSKTLFDLDVRNQLTNEPGNDLTCVGGFLKVNRSVREIRFDSCHMTLNIDGVKSLRSAFYGNKKVTDLEYPQASMARAKSEFQLSSRQCIDEVNYCKASIKQLFKRAYSKYDRRWRDRPNRQKLPFVERIRVAKRKMGANQRDMDKMGKLLAEIRDCVAANRAAYNLISEEKTTAKLNKQLPRVKKLATKKERLLGKLVAKLKKSKKLGRQGKSAKTQVSRKSYYDDPSYWPTDDISDDHWSPSSHWNATNDPHCARLYPTAECFTKNEKPNNEDEDKVPPYAPGPRCPAEHRDLHMNSWSGFIGKPVGVVHSRNLHRDPWTGVHGHFGGINHWWWMSHHHHYYLSSLHHECVELGPDVASEVSPLVDEIAAVDETLEDIGEKTGAGRETIDSTMASCASDFDGAAIAAELDNVPDFQETNDVVEMYGGAGPRDLDDGGSSFGGGDTHVLAGRRRRARTRKANRQSLAIRKRIGRNGFRGFSNHVLPGTCGGAQVGASRSDRPTQSMDNYTYAEWKTEVDKLLLSAMVENGVFQFPDVAATKPKKITIRWNQDSRYIDETPIQVTLVTQCSLDRLGNLRCQLLSWKGSASVAVYVKSSESIEDAELAIKACLHEVQRDVRNTNKQTAGRVDVQIVHGMHDDEAYPINYLRNLALLEANRCQRSDRVYQNRAAVMLVDVDFRPSADLFNCLHCRQAAKCLLQGNEIIVIPAFECSSVLPIPGKIEELKTLVDACEAEPFHLSSFRPGHYPTRFNNYWKATQEATTIEDAWDARYTVDYEPSFEPYIVMATHRVPLYDERFQGYGLNKVTHLESVAHLCGGKFTVLPSVFLVAPTHQRSESWSTIYGKQDTDGTNYNKLVLKGLYRDFQRRLYSNEPIKVSPATHWQRDQLAKDLTRTSIILSPVQALPAPRKTVVLNHASAQQIGKILAHVLRNPHLEKQQKLALLHSLQDFATLLEARPTYAATSAPFVLSH